jgi:hypothetical protein
VNRSVRRLRETGASILILLVVLALVLLLITFQFPQTWPVTVFAIPIVLAMNVLSLRKLVLLSVICVLCVVAAGLYIEWEPRRWAASAVIGVVAVIAVASSRTRSRLGVGAARGESMLIDLRDRLESQSELPVLPREWLAEAVMKSAGGASFAGDFIVAAKTHDGSVLEVAVVDVSGKGINAGTRALLLSGAFGGLLGALPPEDFLPAANEYLLRQEWGEGFATAIHLALHLRTGQFEVRTAGHPPAVQFHAGSGRWVARWTEGPVLGLIPNARFTVYRGTLLRGDALLLYTDGLVETPHRDITFGIDKLLGEAEKLVAAGWNHGARRLVRSIDSENDDRALLMIHRRT